MKARGRVVRLLLCIFSVFWMSKISSPWQHVGSSDCCSHVPGSVVSVVAFSLEQNPMKNGVISTPSGVSAAVLEEMLLLAWYTVCLRGRVPMVQIRWIYAPTSCSSSRDYTVSSEMNSCAHRLCITEVVTPVLFLVWGAKFRRTPQTPKV